MPFAGGLRSHFFSDRASGVKNALDGHPPSRSRVAMLHGPHESGVVSVKRPSPAERPTVLAPRRTKAVAASVLVAALSLTMCGGTVTPAGNPAPTAEELAARAARAAHAAPPAPPFHELGAQGAAFSIDSGMTPSDGAKAIDENVKATECADAIVRAQWQQDIAEVLTPEAHFDNCRIDEGIQYLRSEYAAARAAASAGNVFVALDHLGRTLHSVETFYSHTNFIELAAAGQGNISVAPRLALWDPSEDSLLAPFRATLVSGTVFWESGTCPAGVPAHHDMNKDGPDSKQGGAPSPWHMTYYGATYELTNAAFSRLLKEALADPAWSSVVTRCGTVYGVALAFDKRKD
jgi:hypothetical protein